MAGVNKVYLDSGVAVANFSLATTENYKNKQGEKVSQTEWHNIVLWRGLAEVAEKWLKKGSSVYIEGKIRTNKWEDKEGNTRYNTEILADNMTMLGNRINADVSDKNDIKTASEIKSVNDENDDLPF